MTLRLLAALMIGFVSHPLVGGSAVAQPAEGWSVRVPKETKETARAAEAEKLKDKMLSRALHPLRAFRAEPSPTCQSENLKEAALGAVVLLHVVPKMQSIDGMSMRVGAAVLKVADAARDAKCREVARPLYDGVIQTFVGLAYIALRQRAEIGIADLRASSR